MNLSQFWKPMTQLLVQPMPRKMIFYMLKLEMIQKPCKKGQNLNKSHPGIKDQSSQEIQQVHVWISHP